MSRRGDPWFKFYPADWRGEASLRAVSMAARGLWIEMLCLMHEAEERGHLLLNGRPVSDTQLAALAGVPVEIAQALLGELETAGTFSRTRAGVIFSRRMRADTALSRKQRANVEKRWPKSANSPPAQDAEKPTEIGSGNTTSIPDPIPKKPEAREREEGDANASLVVSAEPKPTSADDVRQAFDLWNARAAKLGLPTARKLDDDRRRAIRSRLADGGLDAWRQALDAVEGSKHCRGENDRQWRADLDFVCQPRSWRRLLEGSYGSKMLGRPPAPEGPTTSFAGPSSLRQTLSDCTGLGPEVVRFNLDRCEWRDLPSPTIIAPNPIVLKKLENEFSWKLRELGVGLAVKEAA